MKRIVVKIGTHSLLNNIGEIDRDIVQNFVAQIKNLINDHKEIIVVTSGAVAQGRFLNKGKADLAKCSYAAVGQAGMISIFHEAFLAAGLLSGQILLSKNDIQNKITYNTLKSTVIDLIKNRAVPIVNENDALSNGTLATFKDNDSLAVVIALAMDAEMIINVSHVEGLYSDDPTKNFNAKLIFEVKSVTKELMHLCDTSISKQGSGGMIAKLRAMRLASAFGITMVIASGKQTRVLERVAAGEAVGTKFLPKKGSSSLKARDRWIVSAKISSGSIVIDPGAAAALKRGKSLLAVGVKKVYGTFGADEVIDVLDLDGDLLAVGKVNIDYQKLSDMLSKKTTYNQEIIHTDNLIVI